VAGDAQNAEGRPCRAKGNRAVKAPQPAVLSPHHECPGAGRRDQQASSENLVRRRSQVSQAEQSDPSPRGQVEHEHPAGDGGHGLSGRLEPPRQRHVSEQPEASSEHDQDGCPDREGQIDPCDSDEDGTGSQDTQSPQNQQDDADRPTREPGSGWSAVGKAITRRRPRAEGDAVPVPL
jgi:hypothetical protein